MEIRADLTERHADTRYLPENMLDCFLGLIYPKETSRSMAN